ncbi:hypothetical protein ACN265_19820 [Micromonospora sp. WMMD730]|uniref:hypothetical protein n=1 Tax=Micromonospora sp. WMMD730 TaxID=3404128 RepID=UPI003B92ABC7
MYVLRNIGDARATGVQVDRNGLPQHTELDLGEGVVIPGKGIVFWAILTAGDNDFSDIGLTWDGREEPVAVPVP